MTEPEFKQFILSQTDFFSKLQLSDVFSFLDHDRKKYLDLLQMKKLYVAEIDDKVVPDIKPAVAEKPKVEDPRDVLTKVTVVKKPDDIPPEEKFSKTEQKLLAEAFKPEKKDDKPGQMKPALKSPTGSVKEISFIKKDKSVSILDKEGAGTSLGKDGFGSAQSTDRKFNPREAWRKAWLS
jgi:hypothetical protein